MHEISLIKNMLQTVALVSKKNDSSRIEKITVELSEFGSLDEDHFRFHFDQEIKGSPWQEACLEIKKVPFGQEARLVSVTFKK